MDREWLTVRLERHPAHIAHSHLLPVDIVAPRAATCLSLSLGRMSKLQLMQLQPHMLVHEHLRWLRRVLGLPWVVVLLLLLLLLLLLELLGVSHLHLHG